MDASASTSLPSRLSASNLHFPELDGIHSLADIARRDLDAALHLLADRAQYITGASGAAIALRRHGKKDMLCRASTGPNAPALGALLSTEFGLSGESVRTRQPLRCDDAERDARVNRDVCRQLGIASVVVMPVVNDDEVLGVFELFSGEVNAFGERDLSAVQRLSEMVETAVRLAEATENLPERLSANEIFAPTQVEQDTVLGAEVLEELVLDGSSLGEVVAEELILEEASLPLPVAQSAAETTAEKEASSASGIESIVKNTEEAPAQGLREKIPTPSPNSTPISPQKAGENEMGIVDRAAEAAPELPEDKVAELAVARPAVGSPRTVISEEVVEGTRAASPNVAASSVETTPSKKQLFWSAALNPVADAGGPEEADQSHVPPLLRSLRKCEACGFPVSAGRVLCVECEEKKWRGQLRVPRAAAPTRVAAPPTPTVAPLAALPRPGARAFAAAAQSVAGGAPLPAKQAMSPASTVVPSTVVPSTVVQSPVDPSTPSVARKDSNPSAQAAVPAVAAMDLHRQKPASELLQNRVAKQDFVFSAGLEPSQSWVGANKYVIGVLVVAAVAVAVFLFLR